MYQRLSREIVLIFLGASLAACGGGGGGGGGTPPEPPVVPQPDTIEKKISDLVALDFTAASTSTQLTIYINHVTGVAGQTAAGENGATYILDQGHLTHNSDNVQLGAVRALASLFASGVLSSTEITEVLTALEGLFSEGNPTLLADETRVLALDIRSSAVVDAYDNASGNAQQKFNTTINTQEYTDLFNLFVTLGRDYIIDNNLLSSQSNDALKFAVSNAYLSLVSFATAQANGTAIINLQNVFIQHGANYIVSEGYLAHQLASDRLAAERTLGDIHTQSGSLPSDVVTALEDRFDIEPEPLIEGEIQALLIEIYETVVGNPQLTLAQARATAEFSKLLSMLIDLGEDQILSSGRLSPGIDNNILSAYVDALTAIEADTQIQNQAIIISLRVLLNDGSVDPQIQADISDILASVVSRTYTEGIMGRYDPTTGTFQENTTGLGLTIHTRNSTEAISILLRSPQPDLLTAQIAIDFFNNIVDQYAPADFPGLSHDYDAFGNPTDNEGGLPTPTTGAALGLMKALMNYLDKANEAGLPLNQGYVDTFYTLVDWLQNDAFSTDANLLVLQMNNFTPNPGQTNAFRYQANRLARDLLGDAVSNLQNLGIPEDRPGRFAEMTALANNIDTGIADNLWHTDSSGDQYPIFGAMKTGDGRIIPTIIIATGEPLLYSGNFSAAVKSNWDLPNSYSKAAVMQSMEDLFLVTPAANAVDAEGVTRYNRGLRLQGVNTEDVTHYSDTLRAILGWEAIGNTARADVYRDSMLAQEMPFINLSGQPQGIGVGDSDRPYQSVWSFEQWDGKDPRLNSTSLSLGIAVLGVDTEDIDTTDNAMN